MTFKEFEKIAVTAKGVTGVYPHYNGKGAVVEFGKKSYTYGGSYGDILHRLGFNVYYMHDLASLENWLDMAIRQHGKKHIFSNVTIDNGAKIKELTAQIDHIRQNFIIIQ